MLPKSSILLLVLSSLISLSVAAETNTTTSSRTLSGQELEDTQYILKNTKPGKSYILNPAQKNQQQYILRTLEQAGKTAQTAPQLYTALNTGMAAAANDTAPQLVTANADAAPQDMNNIIYFDQNGTNYTSAAVSSVVDGTYSTTLNLKITDQAGTTVYGETSQTQYAQGVNFLVPLPNIAVPTDIVPMTISTATYVATKGGQGTTVVTTAQVMTPANKGCMTAPNYCTKYSTDGKSCATYATACTNPASAATKPIKVCYNRTQPQGCDYINPNMAIPPTSFLIPTSGNVTFSKPITSPLSGTWSAQVQNTITGGVCIFALSASIANDPNWTITNSYQLNWNIAQLSSIPPQACLSSANGQMLNFYFIGNDISLGTGTGNFAFTSVVSTASNPAGTYTVPQLEFLDSCLAAGTEVNMADGSRKTVDEINQDKEEYSVKTGKGVSRKVIGTSSGIEPHPMYRIKTDKNQDLLVTRTHPIITARGVVMARDLKIGDKVLTAKGKAKITSLDQEQYSGRVYNLKLGEIEDAKAGKSTFYANGILVGDLRTQTHYEKLEQQKLVKDPAHARERLPKEWQVDFDNHMKSLSRRK